MRFSFVRIENMLPSIVGDDLALSLENFPRVYAHIPLILSARLSLFSAKVLILSAALIVFGIAIVITRFIFS